MQFNFKNQSKHLVVYVYFSIHLLYKKINFMKRISLLLVIVSLFLDSCIPFRTLNSTTYIKPKESFLLGNNTHGKFSAKVTNTSVTPITIWKCPIDGGKHSPITLNPSTTIKVKVENEHKIEFIIILILK